MIPLRAEYGNEQILPLQGQYNGMKGKYVTQYLKGLDDKAIEGKVTELVKGKS